MKVLVIGNVYKNYDFVRESLKACHIYPTVRNCYIHSEYSMSLEKYDYIFCEYTISMVSDSTSQFRYWTELISTGKAQGAKFILFSPHEGAFDEDLIEKYPDAIGTFYVNPSKELPYTEDEHGEHIPTGEPSPAEVSRQNIINLILRLELAKEYDILGHKYYYPDDFDHLESRLAEIKNELKLHVYTLEELKAMSSAEIITLAGELDYTLGGNVSPSSSLDAVILQFNIAQSRALHTEFIAGDTEWAYNAADKYVTLSPSSYLTDETIRDINVNYYAEIASRAEISTFPSETTNVYQLPMDETGLYPLNVTSIINPEDTVEYTEADTLVFTYNSSTGELTIVDDSAILPTYLISYVTYDHSAVLVATDVKDTIDIDDDGTDDSTIYRITQVSNMTSKVASISCVL